MERNKYIIIFLLILVVPLLMSVFLNGLPVFSEAYKSYIVYLGIGIAGYFGGFKIRNKVLLFQMATSLYLILRILILPVLYHDMEIFRFLNMVLFFFIFYSWYYFYGKIIRIREIFFVILLSLFFPYFLLILEGDYNDYKYLLSWHLSIILDESNILIALLLGALICTIKSKILIIFTITFSVLFFLFTSIYLNGILMTYVYYSSFTGEVKKRINITFKNRDGEIISPIKDNENYNVLFIWDDYYRNRYVKMETFQNYYWKFKENKNISFYVVSINSDSKSSYQKYDNHHYVVPLYTAVDSTSFCKELGIYSGREFVCLIKNDTMIYRNTMLKVGEYLEKLIP